MSELKEHIFSDIDEVFPRGYCGPLPSQEARPYYLKSEADKVIEELKNEIEVQKRLRNMALSSVPNVLKVMKIIRHQKYKRCLAMAKWCFTKSNYHFVLARHGEDAKKNSRKSELYAKWHKRWLELADKFKEDK